MQLSAEGSNYKWKFMQDQIYTGTFEDHISLHHEALDFLLDCVYVIRLIFYAQEYVHVNGSFYPVFTTWSFGIHSNPYKYPNL